MKNKNIDDAELCDLIKEGRLEDAMDLAAKQVKWLYANGKKTSMVVDEKLVWKMIEALRKKIRGLEGPVQSVKSHESNYDATFGDDRICTCGHSYMRHFDSFEDMIHVGCKYCSCFYFKEDVAAIAVKL